MHPNGFIGLHLTHASRIMMASLSAGTPGQSTDRIVSLLMDCGCRWICNLQAQMGGCQKLHAPTWGRRRRRASQEAGYAQSLALLGGPGAVPLVVCRVVLRPSGVAGAPGHVMYVPRGPGGIAIHLTQPRSPLPVVRQQFHHDRA